MTSAFAGKFFPRVVIVAAVFAVAAALLALGWGRGSDSAQARHGPGTPAVIFGFDMDTANVGTAGIGGGAKGPENPAVAGQTCNDGIDNAGSAAGIDGADPACQGLGNTSTTLGPIDACRSVPAGVQTDFLFDTFLDGIPAAAPNLAGFGYTIEFPEAAGGIIQTQAHATPGTTILQPNIPLSEVVPDPPGAAGPVGQHLVSEAALGPAPTAGPEVGVVGRYTFRVTAGMAAGTYSLTVLPGTLTLGNSTPADWWATLGTDIIDGYGTGVDGYPSAGAYGIIAVGVPCPTPHYIKITSQNLWDKEVLPNPPGPPIYNCLVGVPPPSNINVSTQEWICVEKTIHNNGPTPQQVLIEKTVDASDPGVPGNDTEVSVHITDPQQVVDIAGGVPYGHKIDTNGDTVPDTVVMDGVGPASLTGLPPSTVIIALNAGVPDEIKLSEKVILQPSIPVTLEENFDVHCEGPSDHTFKISNKISLTDPFGQDPNTNNNTAQSVYNVSCIAQSDLKINTQTITATDPNGPPYIGDDGYDNDGNNGADEDGARDCNRHRTPNDDGDLAIDEDGGDCMTIAVAKDIHNNGGYGPTDYSIVKSITALNGGLGYPFAASLQCVFTPLPGGDPLTGSLSVSNTVTHDESWVMNCPQHGYLVDDDGDSPDGACIPGAEYAAPNCQNYVDEDKPDGLDNDGDGKFDEDGPVSIEIVLVQNQISVDPDSDGDTVPDNHIVDPTPTNNIKVTTKPLTDYRPFNPSFTTFQDDVDPDIQVSPGPSIDCLITLPCKMAFNYSIPGGNPLANTILASPKPAFTFTRAPGFDKVGKITALATIDPSGLGTCSVTLPAIIDLMNGALPATGGFNEGTLIAGTGGAYTPKAMLPGQLADDATDLADNDGNNGADEDPPDV